MAFLANLKLRAAVGAVAALFVAMGLFAMLIYLGSAIYLGFAMIMAPPLAALSAAGSALLFCVLVLMVSRAVVNAATRRNARATPAAATGEVGEMLGAQAHELFKQRPAVGIMASLAAGFAVGMSPRLRTVLRDIILG